MFARGVPASIRSDNEPNGPQAALKQAQEELPDVILLDINSPEMDGYELARHLHTMPAGSHSKLIAATGFY